MKKAFRWVLAFTVCLMQTAEAVNRARDSKELDEIITQQIHTNRTERY